MHETGMSVRQHMSQPEKIVHAVLILCTFGLWYPVYHTRKKQIERVTRFYGQH